MKDSHLGHWWELISKLAVGIHPPSSNIDLVDLMFSPLYHYKTSFLPPSKKIKFSWINIYVTVLLCPSAYMLILMRVLERNGETPGYHPPHWCSIHIKQNYDLKVLMHYHYLICLLESWRVGLFMEKFRASFHVKLTTL